MNKWKGIIALTVIKKKILKALKNYMQNVEFVIVIEV